MAFLLFSPPMVRALVAGAKTQTRRVLRAAWAPSWIARSQEWQVPQRGGRLAVASTPRAAGHLARSPYTVGEVRWVREAWALPRGASWATVDLGAVRYSSTEVVPPDYVRRHGARMPRRFARLGVRVTAVRTERLRDLSVDDALAEGVAHYVDALQGPARHAVEVARAPVAAAWGVPVDDPRATFGVLWCALHHAPTIAEELDRWVTAVTFERHALTPLR